jgi:hypothetical protein
MQLPNAAISDSLRQNIVSFDKVAAVYQRATLERGAAGKVLLWS